MNNVLSINESNFELCSHRAARSGVWKYMVAQLADTRPTLPPQLADSMLRRRRTDDSSTPLGKFRTSISFRKKLACKKKKKLYEVKTGHD